MSLSIRHWLEEHHIDVAQLGHPSAQIAGIAFRIAQDMEVKSLNCFAISALTDVLELPLKAALQMAPAISLLSVALLRILSRKKPLRRNEGTWLTFQVAYLNALQGILEQEAQIRRPWVDRAKVASGQEPDQPLSDPQLIALLKTLRPGRLSDSQAEQALSLIAESFLVQQMNNLAIAWFVANGAEETEAKLLTQRLSNGLPGHLLIVIAENALPLAQLQKFVRLGNVSSLRDTITDANANVDPEQPTATLPLNLPREYYRAGLACALSEPLLGETFALKDLYIPLKGQVVKKEEFKSQDYSLVLAPSSSPPSSPSVDLMEWAMSQLEDKTTIALIEADPGGGKTSFCQMWAYRVAQELYPSCMPIVIRLRDVTLGQTLEQTLESALPVGRFTDADGWLSPSSLPCLLLLDGLDELPQAAQSERYLWTLIEQVMRFHSQDISSTGLPRHKIVLTGRSSSLDCLTRKYRQSSTLPSAVQVQRIVIAPMGHDEFRQWFQQWAKLQSKSIAQAYFTFLKHGGVFQPRPAVKSLAELVTRPIMLYLLGILHRDAWVDESIFQMGPPQIKFEIYDRMTRWLLGEPAAGSGRLPELTREGLAHATRSQEAIANLLQGRHPQDLRHQMQVVALTIIQTGQNQVSQAAIHKRLTAEPTTDVPPLSLPALFFRSQLQKRGGVPLPLGDPEQGSNSYLILSKPAPHTSSLPLAPSSPPGTPSSPLPPYPQRGPRVPPHFFIEFSHPSLGEYLGAEEIALQLTALTQQVQDQYGEVTFFIPSPINVAQHLYGLLGYGLLSAEIAEFVIERLRQEEKRNVDAFSFAVLFKRLYRFYRAYCRGQWLDEGIAHQAHSPLQELHNPLNVLQIDAAVGLNVFVLLCSAAQEAKIAFWPCGNPNIPQEFEADRLLSFISRCGALSPTAFWQSARKSLSKIQLAEACLNRAWLAEANLWQANLAAAELIGSNLAAANLQNANLSWANLAGANLTNANLSGANLEGADLSGANLKGVNFKSANLSNTCLFQAQLDEQTQNFAIKSGAVFSPEEFQAYTQSLIDTKILDDQDGLLEEEPTIFIESAEGELFFPDERYEDDRDDKDYEGETAQIEDLDQHKPVFYDEYDTGEETSMLSDLAMDDIDVQKGAL